MGSLTPAEPPGTKALWNSQTAEKGHLKKIQRFVEGLGLGLGLDRDVEVILMNTLKGKESKINIFS